jgi:hypothetical protein
VKIVGSSFLLCGGAVALAAIRESKMAAFGGALMIITGIGLLRRQRAWRLCALMLLWVVLLGVPLVFLVGTYVAPHVDLGPLALRSVGVTPPAIGALLTLAFVLALWQYRTLRSPEVRGLFGAP